LSSQAEFTLLDFNEETLTYAARRLEGARSDAARSTGIGTRQTSVQQLLRRTLQQGSQLNEQYDFIYCAGLFDYLSEATCKSLVQLFARSVTAGGLVVVANMNDSKPFRIFIEWLLDWFLIYRDVARMKRWCPEAHFSSNIIAEPTTVNLFLHVRAPE
jgi:extracellular factor (EF) 3-hydroxypalmitic acid methyl ester biosynthesis protein